MTDDVREALAQLCERLAAETMQNRETRRQQRKAIIRRRAFLDAAAAIRGQREETPRTEEQEHRLCYVCGDVAYFSNKPLSEQWGDDWNDAPYECNAGTPYCDEPGQIRTVFWHCDNLAPACDGYLNSPWSVQDINGGACAWLKWEDTGFHPGPPVCVSAGVTVREFAALIKQAGGSVYYQGSGGEQQEQKDG